MSNKMKGVLKGLRYISQIFEDGEEPEMQIGFPTDVKHVAHIGWDGPAANAPSWIQKFKEGEPGAPPSNGQERRCSTGSDSVLESPSKRRSDKGKGARRHSSVGSSADSPKRRSASETRTKNSAGLDDSPSRDTSSGTKTTRRRKTKTGSKSKPTSTTPELVYSDSGVASTAENGLQSKDSCQSSVLTTSDNDQISLDDKVRQIHAM